MAFDEVGDNNFESEVLKSQKVVVVDFWAQWCGPCKAIIPKLTKLASDFPDISVKKLNIDSSPDIPVKFGVQSIPTLIIYKDGKPIDHLVGNIPYDKIKDSVKKAQALT